MGSGREVAKGCLESAAASGQQGIQKINDEESPGSDHPGMGPSSIKCSI